jgi:hypothetical protein
MKIWAKLLVPVLILGLVCIADAKGKKNTSGLTGKIVSVSGDGKSITIKPRGKKGAVADPIKIQTDGTTTVEIDGVGMKKVSDLQAGEKVIVQGGTAGPATDIQATSHKGKGKGKHKPK